MNWILSVKLLFFHQNLINFPHVCITENTKCSNFFVSKQKKISIMNDKCILRKKSWLGLRSYIDREGAAAADVIKN